MENPLSGACCKRYPECKCDSIASKVAKKMHVLKMQDIAHMAGIACVEDDCQDCCGEFVGHEFDDSEGGYCLQCNKHESEA